MLRAAHGVPFAGQRVHDACIVRLILAVQCRLQVAQATQLEDKALWETQLVALQDTKHLVQSEMATLSDALASKKRAAAYLHHKQTGQAQISQLQVPRWLRHFGSNPALPNTVMKWVLGS